MSYPCHNGRLFRARFTGVVAAVAVALVSAWSGCSSAYQARHDLLDTLRDRASFELDCSPRALQVEVLETSRGYAPREPLTVGAEGCGARVVYVRQPGRAGWQTASLSRPQQQQQRCSSPHPTAP